MKITEASNNQVKEWKKLQMGKYRKRNGLFLAEGERCVEQILSNDKIRIKELVVREGWVPSGSSDIPGIPVYKVTSSDFESISDTETPQGIIAICEIPGEADIDTLADRKGILLAVDAIQDPGNLGTILRTASWFGVDGILAGKGTVDLFHPKVVRGTAGATGILPYLSGNLEEILSFMEKRGWSTSLLDAGIRSLDIQEIQPGPKHILVIGNEANGISGKLYTDHRKRVNIPGNPDAVESLNAAVACSIALYHFSV